VASPLYTWFVHLRGLGADWRSLAQYKAAASGPGKTPRALLSRSLPHPITRLREARSTIFSKSVLYCALPFSEPLVPGATEQDFRFICESSLLLTGMLCSESSLVRFTVGSPQTRKRDSLRPRQAFQIGRQIQGSLLPASLNISG